MKSKCFVVLIFFLSLCKNTFATPSRKENFNDTITRFENTILQVDSGDINWNNLNYINSTRQKKSSLIFWLDTTVREEDFYYFKIKFVTNSKSIFYAFATKKGNNYELFDLNDDGYKDIGIPLGHGKIDEILIYNPIKKKFNDCGGWYTVWEKINSALMFNYIDSSRVFDNCYYSSCLCKIDNYRLKTLGTITIYLQCADQNKDKDSVVFTTPTPGNKNGLQYYEEKIPPDVINSYKNKDDFNYPLFLKDMWRRYYKRFLKS